MSAAVSGASTGLVDALQLSGLLGPEDLYKLQTYQKAFPHRKDAEVANFLVQQGILTPFQAEVALNQDPRELVLAQFVLTDILGEGSMGKVYKARSLAHDAWYAVKIVPRPNTLGLNMVAEKVKALKEVRHPRVSALVHIGAQGERVYLVWPFLEGGEKLDQYVARQGKLSPRMAVGIALQIASGLQAYHKHGLFHGLLKPSDVLIGTDRRVRLLDFGVGFLLTSERGKSLLDTMTNTRTLARGVDCASPESLLDPLDRSPAGDQYSLGCILYYCLAGQFPFPCDGNPVKKMLAHQAEEPQPIRELNPEVSPRLSAILARMMRKSPQERFASTEEVVQALQSLSTPKKPVLSSAPVEATPVLEMDKPKSASPPAPAWSSRWLALVGLAAGAVLGFTIWLLT